MIFYTAYQLFRSRLNILILLTYSLISFDSFGQGSPDASFVTGLGANTTIFASVVQSNGKVIVAGDFYSFNGVPRKRIARLHTNGNLDAAYCADSLGADNRVYAMELLSNGKLVLVGTFNNFRNISRKGMVVVDTLGIPDPTFLPGTGANGPVRDVKIQADGKYIIVGEFTSFNGVTRNHVARINTNGSVDLTFDPGLGSNSSIYSCSIQSDGKIILGGAFTSYAGSARSRLARINSNGTLDAAFNPGTGANGNIEHVRVLVSGSVLIGGSFTNYNSNSIFRFARILSNGSFDSSFMIGTGANSTVFKTAVQLDNKIIVGGNFTQINGSNRNKFARLNSDGSTDFTFNPGSGLDNLVNAISIQSDGKIILGGEFTSCNGVSNKRVVRIHNAAGSVAPIAAFTVPSNNVCTGQALQFTSTSTNNPASFQWTFVGGSPSSSAAPNPLITYSVPGTYSVQLIASNSFGSDTLINDSMLIVTGPPDVPGPISGNIFPCYSSNEMYFIAPVAGASSYLWTIPSGWAGASTTETIFTLVANQNGILSVSSVGTCGNSLPRTLNVIVETVVPSAPTAIIGDTLVCSATSEAYSISAVFGATYYTWALPSGWTGTSNIVTINSIVGTLGGSLSVSANNSCGASSQSSINTSVITSVPADISITVDPAGPIAAGLPRMFTASTMNKGTAPIFQWKQNGFSVGGNDSTFETTLWSHNDNIVCILNSNAVCVSGSPDTSNAVVLLLNIGIQNAVESSLFRVFPNPSSGKISLTFDKGLHFEKSKISIYNVLGRQVFSSILETMNPFQVENIDMSGQAAGLYFVHIQGGRSNVVGSFILK